LGGCNEPYQIAVFKGQLMLDDAPVVNAQITLQPMANDPNSSKAGPGSYATTDAQGNFEMKLVSNDESGAVVGQHKLFITTSEVDDVTTDAGVVKGERIPIRYSQGREIITVPPSGNENARIAISSDE